MANTNPIARSMHVENAKNRKKRFGGKIEERLSSAPIDFSLFLVFHKTNAIYTWKICEPVDNTRAAPCAYLLE